MGKGEKWKLFSEIISQLVLACLRCLLLMLINKFPARRSVTLIDVYFFTTSIKLTIKYDFLSLCLSFRSESEISGRRNEAQAACGNAV